MDGFSTLQSGQRGYSARLFGSFLLVDARGNDCTPRNRKTRGLAAYLVMSQGTLVSRDQLSSLLWDDRGEEQARASLRQSLYEMRALTIGESRLFSVERSDIQLQHDNIKTDLDSLRQLAGEGEAARLCALVGERPADFLSGFDDLADGFDEWLVGERARRTEERQAAILSAASTALEKGDADHTSRLAAALLANEPYNEAATRLAMKARQNLGDRDGVRRVFARYAESLKAEFGVAPPSEMTVLVGELVAAPMSRGQDGPPKSSAAPSKAEAAGVDEAIFAKPVRPWPPGRISRARLAIAATLTAIFIAAVGAGLWLTRPFGDNARVIMVQPLVTAPGDADARALSRGLASDLSRMILGNDHGLRIADPDGALGFGRRANFVVAGDAETTGGVIRSNVRLLDHANGSILWSRSFERKAAEVDGLRDQIASHLVDVAVCALGGHNPSLAQLGVEITRYYLQACEDKHGDFADSAKLLTLIVQRRPDFAHAWAMLAAATGVVALGLPDDAAAKSQFDLAATYAHRALALDPHDGEAYLGLIYAKSHLGDWPARQDLLIKGHTADPNNAVLDILLAADLSPVGRVGEGRALAQRAVELDPFNPWAAQQLMTYTGYQGDLDGAQSLYKAASQRWPDDAVFTRLMFDLFARTGDPASALALLDSHAPPDLPPVRIPLWRAFLKARQSRSDADVDQLTRAIAAETAPSAETRVVNAAFYTVLGRTELAFSVLDHLGKAPISDSEVFFWNFAEPLRADPRFIDIANRVGLVSIWRKTNHWPDFCADPKLPYDCRRVADKLKN